MKRRLQKHLKGFGARVKEIRGYQGWTQAELAKRAKMHHSYISQIESGKRYPNLKNFIVLVDALNWTPDLLLDWDQ